VTSPWAMAEAETAKAENQTRFTLRVAQNQRRVFQIAYSVLGNSAEAEDVTQETFLNAYRNLASLHDEELFRGWVNRIAFRLALNRQRSLRRRLTRDTAWHAEAPETTDGEKTVQDRLLLEQLRRAIEKLPRKLQQVLQLSTVEEMDATQVGLVLGIPAGTVRSRLHTARKLLLEAMK
jgi:RNA polymerase sigma-70 factor, ECF subfamily